ncbi:MAG: hypothetical protein LBQ77_05005 [Treponema sp.]|jgi:hypothetical protein|nr:hypothetical protein [Treponema sp.]
MKVKNLSVVVITVLLTGGVFFTGCSSTIKGTTSEENSIIKNETPEAIEVFLKGTTIDENGKKVRYDGKTPITLQPGEQRTIIGTVQDNVKWNYLINDGTVYSGSPIKATYNPVLTFSGGERTAGSRVGSYYEQKGLYIGVIAFADDAIDLTQGQPIYLGGDGKGYDELNNILDTKYVPATKQGTALYYAVHKALANLSSIDQYLTPDTVNSVNIVTFTDGLDNNSTNIILPVLEDSYNGQATSSGDYSRYITGQLQTGRQIAEHQVVAFSVGERGKDVEDTTAFRTALTGLASKPDYAAYEEGAAISAQFDVIADQLITLNTDRVLTIRTPAYPVGTRIRITFGDVVDGGTASRYLDGIIGYEDGSYKLTIIRYQGITTSVPTNSSVTGKADGSAIIYQLSNGEGFEQVDTVKQWYEISSGVFQGNSEADLAAKTNEGITEKTSIIYLVLDNSTSLNEDGVNKVRQQAKKFVDQLYGAYTRKLGETN